MVTEGEGTNPRGLVTGIEKPPKILSVLSLKAILKKKKKNYHD